MLAAKEGKNRFLILRALSILEHPSSEHNDEIIFSSSHHHYRRSSGHARSSSSFRPSSFPSLTYSLVNLSLASKKFHEFNIHHPYRPHSSSHQIEEKRENGGNPVTQSMWMGRMEWNVNRPQKIVKSVEPPPALASARSSRYFSVLAPNPPSQTHTHTHKIGRSDGKMLNLSQKPRDSRLKWREEEFEFRVFLPFESFHFHLMYFDG